MIDPTPPYTLSELCKQAGVSERTVRYYVKQGLLPSPGTGRGVRWSHEHLERLEIIRRLKDKHLPLAEIRRRLESMSAAEVSALLASQQQEPPATSASDYVRKVLAGVRPPSTPVASPPPRAKKSARSRAAGKATPPPASQAQSTRTTWERITLDADVEIHVRRPLSRQQDRRVKRLLSQARDIFEKDES